LLKRIRAKHTLGLDPAVDTGSRKETHQDKRVEPPVRVQSGPIRRETSFIDSGRPVSKEGRIAFVMDVGCGMQRTRRRAHGKRFVRFPSAQLYWVGARRRPMKDSANRARGRCHNEKSHTLAPALSHRSRKYPTSTISDAPTRVNPSWVGEGGALPLAA
jgi:hypothetical protein